jgi:quercetin dioxygenase-like cupin family protein
MLSLKRIAPLGIIGLLVAMATIALASPPSGQRTSPPVTGTLEPVDVEADGVELETERPTDVATFTLTLDPAGFTGWHVHPGALIATVQSGAVVREVACRARTYAAGETFVEHGDEPTGQVRNASVTVPAVFTVTQIAPSGVPRRVETDPPTCRRPHHDRHSNRDPD